MMGENRNCSATVKEIGAAAGLSHRAAVVRAIGELAESGLLAVTRHGPAPSTYAWLQEVPQGATPEIARLKKGGEASEKEPPLGGGENGSPASTQESPPAPLAAAESGGDAPQEVPGEEGKTWW